MSNAKQFKNFEKSKELKFWDEEKVLLASFENKETKSLVRYFRKKPEDFSQLLSNSGLSEEVQSNGISEFKKGGVLLQGYDVHQNVGKHLLKIPSRTVLSTIREPFEINPWDQCLVDEAVKYGSKIDDNLEDYLTEKITGEKLEMETKVALKNILDKTDWKWASRSQMVCHSNASIYGEIDEIWYSEKDDMFYVGDTKTSSTVDKLSYWYQLGVYIEILKSFNPEIANKISTTATIQWVKFKNEKWKIRPDFNDKDQNGVHINIAKRYEYSKWILENMDGKKPETITRAQEVKNEIEGKIIPQFKGRGMEAKPDSEYYWMKWSQEKEQLPETEWKCELLHKDLEAEGILSLVRDDINFITKYNISTEDEFNELINSNPEAKRENELLQSRYNNLK